MSSAQTLPYAIGQQTPNDALRALLEPVVAEIGGSFGQTSTDLDIRVTPEQLLPLVKAFTNRRLVALDFLRNISGVDLEAEGLALKYAFYSFRHGHACQVTVSTAYGHPQVPSLTGFYPAADWHEREAAEMFGFVFVGHPDLKNLLLEEDLHIHPLLKAHPLQPVEVLQGIEDTSPGVKL